MQEVHAVLMTGGSAFGLAAADGVMQWLAERDTGYQTPWAKVPIVPAAVVFDLNVGTSSVRPGRAEGYKACEAASETQVAEGNVGAGTGTTVGKWAGMETWMKGGAGSASCEVGSLTIGTIAVVNAVGDIIDENGKILAGARKKDGQFLASEGTVRQFARGKALESSNTTLVLMACNADLSKLELFKVCQRMHDGMARAVVPAHTSYDGDVSFALSAGTLKVDLDVVAELAADLTAKAIRNAVRAAKSLPGIPAVHS